MTISIASPLSGWAVSLADVPDPVFADRMLGDGVAIDPVEGRLVAPGDGQIVSIHPAGHAVTIALDAGPVLLMHIGLETVGLGGAGFTPHVKDGQRVVAGDLLVEFDLDQLARIAKSLITPVIITNGEAFAPLSLPVDREVTAGAGLMEWRASGESAKEVAAAAPTVSRSLDLPLAHGLHARPAARIAQLAASLDGTAEIVGPSGRSASAKSAVAMLALALRHGDVVIVRGSDAAGVDAIADLLASGMGEFLAIDTAPVVPPAPVARVLPPAFKGVVAVPGIAIGPAFRIRDQLVDVPPAGRGIDHERASLAQARDRIRAELQADAGGEGDRASIATAHLVLLDDPELDRAAQADIAAGKSAAFAWSEAVDGFAALLKAADDARLRERADDLADLRRRVVAALSGAEAAPLPPEGAVVVAEELYPSQLMALAGAGIAGIATARGGTTSHAAIIAAGIGLPMLVSLGADFDLIEDGTPLVIDGNVLLVAPDDVTVTRIRATAETRRARRQAAVTRAHEIATTTDGTRIEVFANLGSVADVRAAVLEGAEGCGLLRTEFLFLDRAAPPSEDEQRATYQAIADALGPRPLIVRTLDIGADKPARWLPMAAEENPALGLRGIRLQLARTDLLESQFRALLGVRGEAPLRIMLPMVADRDELIAARDTLVRLAAAMGVAAPELGIMVETPAAALTAATLAADAAFFSIGTNDLSQYALARDRTNAAVAAGLDGLHPAVLRLIAETVKGGHVHGRWTGVCGGLAAEPAAVPLLIGLGVTELSVPGAAVAETKALVRTLDLNTCRALAAQALVAPDASSVRTLVALLLEQAA
jgi:phosphocarrier protein FPr/phosphocarrier protein